jgi:hypothetical protein
MVDHAGKQHHAHAHATTHHEGGHALKPEAKPVVIPTDDVSSAAPNVTGMEDDGQLTGLLMEVQAGVLKGDPNAVAAMSAITTALANFSAAKAAQQSNAVSVAAATDSTLAAASATGTPGTIPVGVGATVQTPTSSEAVAVSAVVPQQPSKEDLLAKFNKLPPIVPGTKTV